MSWMSPASHPGPGPLEQGVLEASAQQQDDSTLLEECASLGTLDLESSPTQPLTHSLEM